jgi:hypothetical protein
MLFIYIRVCFSAHFFWLGHVCQTFYSWLALVLIDSPGKLQHRSPRTRRSPASIPRHCDRANGGAFDCQLGTHSQVLPRVFEFVRSFMFIE